MPNPLYTFGKEAIDQLDQMARWYRSHVMNPASGAAEPFTKFGPRTFRCAKTTVSDEFPTYPPRPANTFVVEFGEVEFLEEPGCRTRTFTAYTPTMKRVAHMIRDSYIPINTLVYIFMAHGKWYIEAADELLLEGTLYADMCGEVDGILLQDTKLLPRCEVIAADSLTVKNPRRHRGPAGHNVIAVKKACDDPCVGSATQWQILDVEVRPLCTVNGIENTITVGSGSGSGTTGCIKYGSVIVGGEWCPADEPDLACKLIDLGPCTGDIPECDLTWTVLVSSCCVNGGSGSGS